MTSTTRSGAHTVFGSSKLDQKKDIKCHFDKASRCEYPLFTLDSSHDQLDLLHMDMADIVQGYWCEWVDV